MNIQEYIHGGAIESFVLGLADEQDVAELQRLKELHPEVAAALDAAENWLQEYAYAHAVPPAEEIRAKLLNMLDSEAGEPAEPTPVYRPPVYQPPVDRPPVYQLRARNRYKALAAASVILLMVSAGYNYYLHRNYAQAVADYALLSNPSVIKVPLLGVAGKENAGATLYWNSHNKLVYLDAARLPKAPSGSQYQLWALVDGKPIDAGVLENCPGVCALKIVQKAQAFAITLEKAGGSPTPTLSQMVVMGNVKS